MPFRLGVPELLIVLLIIVLLFGVGRVSKVGGELGKGIRSFKEGLKGDKDNQEETPKEEKDEKPK